MVAGLPGTDAALLQAGGIPVSAHRSVMEEVG